MSDKRVLNVTSCVFNVFKLTYKLLCGLLNKTGVSVLWYLINLNNVLALIILSNIINVIMLIKVELFVN